MHIHTARKVDKLSIEFIMMFLAVFPLAEYQRTQDRKRKSGEILQSMLLDVRTNISNLDSF
jgi:hypothetical protein